MKNILIDVDSQILTLTIHRPAFLNALNSETFKEINELLDKLIKEQTFKAVILTGSGDKAFIAGADIHELAHMDHLQMSQLCELGHLVADKLENGPFLTIAAVNGYCLGGGLEMAMACDFIYASKTAKFGLPEVSLGLIPGFGGTQRLPRIVGLPMAKEMILSGKQITATEALRIGLINRICDSDTLLTECKLTAKAVLDHSATALLNVKKAIQQSQNVKFADGLNEEFRLFSECFHSKESKMATNNFLKKKKN